MYIYKSRCVYIYDILIYFIINSVFTWFSDVFRIPTLVDSFEDHLGVATACNCNVPQRGSPRFRLLIRVSEETSSRVMALPKTPPAPLALSVSSPVAMTGSGDAFNKRVDFNVFLASGRFAIISCLSTETLKGLQLQIAGLLGLKAAKPLWDGIDGIPLLNFFRLSDLSGFNSLLRLDTLAAELQGCSVQVLQQEHPEWCRQRCFFKHSPAMDWDIEEEITEWLWFFSDGQFRYLRHRNFWNDATHTRLQRLAEVMDREELECVGHWNCALIKGIQGIHGLMAKDSSLEEVVMLEGFAQTFQQSSQNNGQRSIRMTFSKTQLLEKYENFLLDPCLPAPSEFSAPCEGSSFWELPDSEFDISHKARLLWIDSGRAPVAGAFFFPSVPRCRSNWAKCPQRDQHGATDS